MSIFKTIVFFLIVSTASVFTNDKEMIYGRWNIDKVEDVETGLISNVPKFIEFKENGILESGNIGKKIKKSARWTYNSENKYITISESGSDDGDYAVILLNKESLIIKKNNIKIYLIKGQI